MRARRNVTLLGLAVVLTFIFVMSAVYTVDEGHVGIVKRWGKAITQVDPGLHIKIPIMDAVEVIDVRQRKNVEQLAAATQNQLAIVSTVSINWTVQRPAAMQLFVEYGGLDQFENRILDPKLRSASKAALALFPADKLIANRQAAVTAIHEEMIKVMEGFPVNVDSPQIEDINFPQTYRDAVLAKEQERENAEREKHALERQRLVAQQKVNTANAEAEAVQIAADAEAYRLEIEAKAESEAIRLINEQLTKSPQYIELLRAKRWDGVLPRAVLGGEAQVLYGLGQ